MNMNERQFNLKTVKSAKNYKSDLVFLAVIFSVIYLMFFYVDRRIELLEKNITNEYRYLSAACEDSSMKLDKFRFDLGQV